MMKAIETARTVLRMFTIDDLDELAAILGNPRVMRYLEIDCQPITREQTEFAITNIVAHWKKHRFGRWAVIDKESSKVIGMTGFRSHEDIAELVYVLDEPFWGKGLATEIARACLEYGFATADFPRIIAMTRPANRASRRVMDKLGMIYQRKLIIYGISVVEYAVSKEEFQSLEN